MPVLIRRGLRWVQVDESEVQPGQHSGVVGGVVVAEEETLVAAEAASAATSAAVEAVTPESEQAEYTLEYTLRRRRTP